MVPQVPQIMKLIDTFTSLGVGLILASLCDLLGVLAGRGKIKRFICDIVLFSLSAVILISFAISQSHTGYFRWYMLAGTITGFAAYRYIVTPITDDIYKKAKIIILIPILLIKAFVLPIITTKIDVKKKAFKSKMANRKKITEKDLEEHLPKEVKVLYNSV